MKAWLRDTMNAVRARQRRERMADLERRKAASPMYQEMVRWARVIQEHPVDTSPIDLTRRQWEALKQAFPPVPSVPRGALPFAHATLGQLTGRPVHVVDTQAESTFPEWTP